MLSCLLLTGCGGSGGSGTATASGGGKTLEQLWRAEGDDVAVVPGTQNYVPGSVRLSFLVIDSQGRAVTLPTARVWVSDALDRTPFLETEAKIERIGIPGGETSQRDTHLRRPPPAAPGGEILAPRRARRWPEGPGARERRRREGRPTARHRRRRPCIEARRRCASTRGDVSASRPARRLTCGCSATRSPARSRRMLLRRDLRDAEVLLEPLCGPMVDVLDDVAQKLEGTGVRSSTSRSTKATIPPTATTGG